MIYSYIRAGALPVLQAAAAATHSPAEKGGWVGLMFHHSCLHEYQSFTQISYTYQLFIFLWLIFRFIGYAAISLSTDSKTRELEWSWMAILR